MVVHLLLLTHPLVDREKYLSSEIPILMISGCTRVVGMQVMTMFYG